MPTITNTLYRAAAVFILIAGLVMPVQAEETATRTARSITYAANTELDETARAVGGQLELAEQAGIGGKQ